MKQPSIGVVVSGSIALSNGQPPDIFTMGGGTLQPGAKRYRCHILGRHIFVEYPDGTPTDDVDDIFRVTRHLVDSTILSRVVTEGIGLSCQLDHCRTASGEVHLAPVDRAPDLGASLDRTTVARLMGVLPQLRYAVRDFNQGLLDREDSPVYFYRVVETLAKLICRKETGLSETDWGELHESLGTTSDDTKDLLDLNKQHRHGTHKGFSRDDHHVMMATARLFLDRTIRYLDEHREYIPDPVREAFDRQDDPDSSLDEYDRSDLQ